MAEILFVNAVKEMAVNREANGTLLLGTKLLEAGFDVDVLRFGEIPEYQKDYHLFIEKITQRILQSSPKCVSFYALWPYFHIVLRIAISLKAIQPDLPVIMGGPQASATAKAIMDAMDFVDYVCTGEGENTVVPFFTSILRRGGEGLDQVPGLYYRKDGAVVGTNIEIPLCDLNTLPQWDDRLYIHKYQKPEPNITRADYFMNMDVGRGCPYNCSFCSTSYFWRRTYRLKTPERIVEDIRFYYDKFGIRSFGFSHDAFTTNPKLVEQVCDYFLEQGLDITWNCSARIDCIDEKLILKMEKAGMTQIELGIETGSKRMQKITHKNLNLDRAKKMADFVMKTSVKIGLFFMCGFPEETLDDLRDTLDLMFELVDKGLDYVNMSFCRFNPNTEIANTYFDELYFDPTIKMMGRGIYGYDEELDMIVSNKAVFPFFYHYETPVRREFQYLPILVSIYRDLPHSAKYLRQLYKGDNIEFYRDFIRSNRECFDSSIDIISAQAQLQPVQMLTNMLKKFHVPYEKQLESLMVYDFHIQRLRESKDGTVIQDIYHFNYEDLLNNLPIEQYTNRPCLIRLEKKDGNISKQAYQVK